MKERVRGIILNYMTMGFKLLIGLFYTPFMLSSIGDSQYGILSIANSFIIFITLLDCGFGQTIIRYQTKNLINRNKEEASKLNGFFLKLYLLVSVVAIFVGLVIMFGYPALGKNQLTIEEMKLFRQVFFILLVNSILTFPLRLFSADLQVHQKFSVFKGVNLVLLVLRYTIMTVLLVQGYQVVSLAVVISATSLATQFIYLCYSIRKLSFQLQFGSVDRDLKKEIISFSFYIFLNLLVDFIYDNTDKLLLGAIRGTVSVTVYTLGVTIYSYYKQMSTSISGVYMPKIVSEYEQTKDMTKMSEIFTRVGKLQLTILIMILDLFIIFGKQFLRIWVGEGYENAYYVGLLIMIPAIVPLSQNVGQSILRAMNLHKYRSVMYVISAICNISLTIPLAFTYGEIGAAVATCICTTLGEIIFMNWFYAKKVKLNLAAYWTYFFILTLVSVFIVVIVMMG